MKLDMITDPTSLSWLPYHPLEGAGRNKTVPIEPGLYRIRRVGRTDLDYIGTTSFPAFRRGFLLPCCQENVPGCSAPSPLVLSDTYTTAPPSMVSVTLASTYRRWTSLRSR